MNKIKFLVLGLFLIIPAAIAIYSYPTSKETPTFIVIKNESGKEVLSFTITDDSGTTHKQRALKNGEVIEYSIKHDVFLNPAWHYKVVFADQTTVKSRSGVFKRHGTGKARQKKIVLTILDSGIVHTHGFSED